MGPDEGALMQIIPFQKTILNNLFNYVLNFKKCKHY